MGKGAINSIYLLYENTKIHINTWYSFVEYLKDDKESFDYLLNVRK